ncbi:anthocyanidin-3-O-glucoside rhamnosyltransferase-like [Phoenix dactylifera]|uniref:Glycosyltransferase n=1 Tax=Phoenix dactylifera TaxID=42345 RepID=A0A8B7BJN9_PHODC|nr:anthocyanidin-3-O-glucoside rhamnosyltransferase-like [Phoenix dactylifera]
MGGTATNSPLHVLLFPWPAFGHISPFIQLARKLSTTGGAAIRISFLSIAGNIPRIATLLPSDHSIAIIPLDLPQVPGLPADATSTADMTPAAAELLKLAVDLTKPQVESLLRHLRPHFVFFDFAMQWLPSLAHSMGIKSLHFSIFATICAAYNIVPSRRLHGPNPSVDDLKNPPDGFPSTSSVSTIPSYQAADFLYLFKRFDNGPCVYDRVVACLDGCTAVVAKTCMELEGQYIAYVESQFQKPFLLAGPLVPEPPSGELEERRARWLDGFPEESVVFSSFGSETFLSDEGVKELVLGLEMTGLPFFVVLNFPKNSEGREEEEELRRKLPEGFGERVKGRGVLHRGWVQQQHILRHKSVGCFVCHAGMSSVMEGVMAGCQLVMLPQKGDQYLNAALFARDLEIGVEVERRGEDGVFGREGVCKAVRKVMTETGEESGRRVRENHRKLKEFLMDEEVQEKFMVDMLEKLKELAIA